MKDLNELDSLLSLLDDPNPSIYADVADRILAIGYKTYVAVSAYGAKNQNPLVKKRCATIAEKLRYSHYLLEIKKWAHHNTDENWDFVFLANEFCDAEFRSEDAKATLAGYQEQFLLRMKETDTPEENTELLQKLIFEKFDFKFNYQPLDLSGLLLNGFFTNKKGSALLICMLYILLAQEAGIPVSVVAFPGNVVLVYTRTKQVETVEEILFYINPANGEIFSKNGIDLFLKKHDLENKLRYYLPCSTIEIAALYIFTLKEAYATIGSVKKVDELNGMLDMLIEIIEKKQEAAGSEETKE